MKYTFLKESYIPKKFIEKKQLKEDIDTPFAAFITNLGKYNEGELVGEWQEFPATEEEFNQTLSKIGIDPKYYEWFVTDYDCDVVDAYAVLGEYPSFDELNDFSELIEHDAFKALLQDQSNFEYAKDMYESGDYVFYPGIDTWEDFAQEHIESLGGVDSLDTDTIARYFDYEALGRDLDLDDYEGQSASEYWCGTDNASDEEIGEAAIDALGIEGVPNPQYYFDYEAYGRDLSFDGTLTDYGVLIY